ncbi:hypothetical protein T12_16345 [Trichinella patagoniensis]|uniref:Uncharacterized protein n=1 Tax=Trichinella patagoniensis TaxID=990121 RepID=A0A0V1AFU9_9BILA|nr:hypothetical protein T12_16345 [Trichinella patagoniensis]
MVNLKSSTITIITSTRSGIAKLFLSSTPYGSPWCLIDPQAHKTTARALIFGWKLVSFRRKSPRISRFSLFLCFDKIAFTNSSDVMKDKGLCNTFIKLLEQSRILSNCHLNDHSRRNKLLRWDFKVHIRSRNSSTPIGPLCLYRPLRESHRPQGVDIDHFGYP